jgi:hypothetical protein
MTYTGMTREPTTGVHQYLSWRETGFGADRDTRAMFAVSEWNEFERDIRFGRKEIVGTGRTKSQTTHIGLLRVTWPIITTMDHYRRLVTMLGTIETLILPYGLTVHYDADSEFTGPDLWTYVVMSNMKLLSITSGTGDGDGRKKASVSFEQVNG